MVSVIDPPSAQPLTNRDREGDELPGQRGAYGIWLTGDRDQSA
ncbi:hypothetical protein SLI_0545 [Streptomyces lividans 1326]|uniref:Uncharacterized protein n=1 Tax=Streptomyces lividans 1326 TaxID=1200984 RepID=A0A7U9H8R5_STRLI|nr:hypothetical protein SLI_0545 [Streptomyces lividans 1326]